MNNTVVLLHRHHQHDHHGGNTCRAAMFMLLLVILSLVFSAASLSLNRPSNKGMEERERGSGLRELIHRYLASQKRLGGPGSSPPTCRSKCGSCYPCTPVHVAVHPGMSMPLEYYPEAWRCKCGNKLFMP